MKPQPLTLGTSLRRRMLIQLSKRSAWRPGLAVWALIIFTFATFAYDLIRTGNFDQKWVLIWAVTYVEVVVVAMLALVVLPKSLWTTVAGGLTTNLVLAGSLGAIKNPSVYLLAVMLGLEEEDWDPFLRIGRGIMLTGTIFVLYVVVYSSRLAHEELMKQIQARHLELEGYRKLIPQTTSDAKQDLIRLTKDTLLPKLRLIERLLQNRSTIRPVILNLQDLIESSVRPLSKAFQQQAEQLGSEHSPISKWNAGYRFPSSFRLRENIPVTAILGLALPSLWFVFYMTDTLDQWIPLVLGSCLLALTVLFCKFSSPANRTFDVKTGVTRIIVLSSLAPLPPAVTFLFMLPDELESKALIVGSTLFIACISMSWVVYVNVLDDMRGSLELENQSVNEKIAFELALFNQTLWLQKRRWGYLLHGKVQSNLTAALARLRSLEASAVDNPTQEGMLIELVRQDLNRAADALNGDALGSVDLAQELANIQDSWRGVVDVSIQISDRARRALERSDNIRMSLVEICREAVTNAHRHGSATTMTIQIDRQDDTTMQLTCTNNGSEPKTKSGGMGTQMMDALTIDWSLEHKKTAGLTVLSARLPIAV